MSLWVLSGEPDICAQHHPDTLVATKLEQYSCILAYSVKRVRLDTQDPPMDHPWVKWASKTRDNFLWLAELCIFLMDEYQQRFREDEPPDDPDNYVRQSLNNMPQRDEFECHFIGGLTPFVRDFGDDDYQDIDDTIEAYRHHLIRTRPELCDWMHGEPDWAHRLTDGLR